ncbi:MAG: dihydrodipicolinate reductase [Verrucomicrobia bacterium]|nr:dihydrodipicolinate reductase [Verrucomicrobiota bacterium]
MKTKVAQFGLGPIGIETLRLAAAKPWVEIVGGIDIDPQKVGRSLTEVTGIKGLESVRVYSSVEQLPVKPDVALHTTVSRFKAALPQLQSLARAGISVVSSCEELLFPRLKDPAGAAELDALCQKHGARMVGTGVNPGFVMDVLPVCLTGVCRSVGKIEVTRVVNASSRRLPLQKKIGSGLDPEEFRRLFREGKMGHVGLVESLALVAHCLKWPIGPIKETCEPVIATEDIKTEFLEVKKGLTCGIHHRAEAAVHGQTVIELDLQMYLDAINPRDVVRVAGDPTIEFVETGGVQGDRATVAAVVNAVPRVLKAPPGLLLMTDLSVPCVS